MKERGVEVLVVETPLEMIMRRKRRFPHQRINNRLELLRCPQLFVQGQQAEQMV